MKNNIRQSIIAWSNRFPLDRWWRNKYNVSYLSTKHRESTFYAQYYEYYEDIMFKEYHDEKEKGREKIKEEGGEKSIYVPLSDNWWIGKISSKKEVEDWFNIPIK